MQNLAKSMSVASLNSAIEAGHLGEQGVRYVETAEKMRTMSEEYKQKAEVAAKTLMDIKDGFYQSRDSLMKLEDTFLREDAELKRISEETENFLQARQKQNEMEESFSAEGLISELDNLEENLDGLQDKMSTISEKFKYTISNSEKNDTDLERILGGIKDGAEK
jgi:chromosome segregation ATPase